eukprot:GHVU01150264.1.p2 GENE.GHVU01150264.1~~GHVU01150264.1.p2  ORF type:complete len:123 (-),score=4.71 GHVU01150264.1:325-693(-)
MNEWVCVLFCFQVACDASCKIVSLSMNSPGSTNDSMAYDRSGFKEQVEALPPGFVVAGDAAYPIGVHEMTFGLLFNKWRIFHRPLSVHIRNVGPVVETCCTLHNYAISRRVIEHGATEARGG